MMSWPCLFALLSCCVLAFTSPVAGDACPAEQVCQNDGKLVCSYTCLSGGIQVDLECRCDCTDQYFGAVCEWPLPCENGETPPTTSPSTEGTTHYSVLNDYLVFADWYKNPSIRVYDYITGAVTGPSFYPGIITLTVSRLSDTAYYSHYCCGVRKVSLPEGSDHTDVIVTGNRTTYHSSYVTGIAVDEAGPGYLFLALITGEVQRRSLSGEFQLSYYTAPCVFCILGITLDVHSRSLYVGADLYSDGFIVQCQYDGGCQRIIENIPRDINGIYFNYNEQLLFWTHGIQSSGRTGIAGIVYMHDFYYNHTVQLAYVEGYRFEGATLRGDTLYIRSDNNGQSASTPLFEISPYYNASITPTNFYVGTGWGLQ